MTDPTAAAAERLRRIEKGERLRAVYADDWVNRLHVDNEALAAEYLRLTDETPISEEALREMGFTYESHEGCWTADLPSADDTLVDRICYYRDRRITVGRRGVPTKITTLGALRRLLSVLTPQAEKGTP